MQIKRTLRRTLGRISPVVLRARPAQSLLILTYHRVLPPGHPARRSEQPGMYVSPESLAMHLRVLKRYFEIVDLGEWLKRRRDGSPLPDRACCITFDDGWRDNYEHGFPVLKAAEVPSTIFLVADFIGTRYRFWPNRLAALLNVINADMESRLPAELTAAFRRAGFVSGEAGAPVSAGQIDNVINACKSLPDHVLVGLLDAAEAEGAAPVAASDRDLLDLREVRAMRDSGLVCFGSHSRRHTRLLAPLDAGSLNDEVGMSRRILEGLVERPIHTFCYPNGDYSPAALALVRSTYQAAVTTVPGWNQTNSDPHLLRRMSIHEDIAPDEASFLARVAGVV